MSRSPYAIPTTGVTLLGRVSLTLAAVLTTAITLAYKRFEPDDAYIFYTYARNIAEGFGYTFNPAEHFNGTTSPLYTLVLAASLFVAKPFAMVTLPLISSVWMAVCIWLGCFFGAKILADRDHPWPALLFPLVLPLHPYLRNAVGMETYLTVALILAAAHFYQRDRLTAVGALCGFAVLARPDSFLFVGALGIHYLLTRRKLPPWTTLVAFLLVVTPWLVFSKLYFGVFLPSSVVAKIGQSRSSIFGTGSLFIRGFWTQFPTTSRTFALFAALTAVSIAVAAVSWRRLAAQPALCVIAAWSVLLALTYVIANPPAYQWYFTPFAVGSGMVLCLGLGPLVRSALARLSSTMQLRAALGVLMLIGAAGLYLPVRNLVRDDQTNWYKDGYTEVSTWLTQHAAPGASVGCDEVGFLGYYYRQGPVLDSLGLVTPGVSVHVTKGDTDWFYLTYRPDYVLLHRPVWSMEHIVDNPWFAQNYRLVKELEIGTIYQRLAVAPPTRR